MGIWIGLPFLAFGVVMLIASYVYRSDDKPSGVMVLILGTVSTIIGAMFILGQYAQLAYA